MRLLSQVFAIDVRAYVITSNHYYLVLQVTFSGIVNVSGIVNLSGIANLAAIVL